MHTARPQAPTWTAWVGVTASSLVIGACIALGWGNTTTTMQWTAGAAPATSIEASTITHRTAPIAAPRTMASRPTALPISSTAALASSAPKVQPWAQEATLQPALNEPVARIIFMVGSLLSCVGLASWALLRQKGTVLDPLPLEGVSHPQFAMAAVTGKQATSNSEFSNLMVQEIKERFGDEETQRIVDAWLRMDSGAVYEEALGSHPLMVQKSHFYVEGLGDQPKPVWDNADVAWASALEAGWADVKAELDQAIAMSREEFADNGSLGWVNPVQYGAQEAYGPNWETLGLVSQSQWDEATSALFPATSQLLRNAGVPLMEACFAKLPAGGRIMPHTDGGNFILTGHLGLQVPKSGCTLNVGDASCKWRDGEVLVFDSSFMHEASNKSSEDRYVLLVRAWHPDMTPVEITAATFLLDCIAGRMAEEKAASGLSPPAEPYTIEISEETWKVPGGCKTFDTTIFGPGLTLFDRDEGLYMSVMEGGKVFVEPGHRYEVRQIQREYITRPDVEEEEPVPDVKDSEEEEEEEDVELDTDVDDDDLMDDEKDYEDFTDDEKD